MSGVQPRFVRVSCAFFVGSACRSFSSPTRSREEAIGADKAPRRPCARVGPSSCPRARASDGATSRNRRDRVIQPAGPERTAAHAPITTSHSGRAHHRPRRARGCGRGHRHPGRPDRCDEDAPASDRQPVPAGRPPLVRARADADADAGADAAPHGGGGGAQTPTTSARRTRTRWATRPTRSSEWTSSRRSAATEPSASGAARAPGAAPQRGFPRVPFVGRSRRGGARGPHDRAVPRATVRAGRARNASVPAWLL